MIVPLRAMLPGGTGGVLRIVVMGATGTVGSAVLSALDRASERVAAVRNPSTAQLPEAVSAVHLDLTQPETLAPALEGADALFFMTPLIEDQVSLSRACLAAALRAGVHTIVRLSSRAASWDRECPLRGWHRELDEAVLASPAHGVVLRPCSFFQNLLGPPLRMVTKRGVLPLPLGEGRIPFIDARDIGEAAAIVLLDVDAYAGQTYTLTGAVALGGEQLAAGLARSLGHPVSYLPLDHDELRRRGPPGGMPDWLYESGLRVYAHAAAGREAEVDPALPGLLGHPPRSYSDFLALVSH